MTAASAASLLEHLVFEIAQGMAGETGEGFFRSLVRQLAIVLDADYVLAAALLPGAARVSTLAAFANGKEAPPFEYDLAGTPCEGVVNKQVCSFPSGIQTLFPQDAMLVKMRAEGYAAAPIEDSTGRCLGLICALTSRPLLNSAVAEALIRIFAARAAAELERKADAEALERSEQWFRDFVIHGTEAIVRIAVDQPIPLDLSEDQQIESAHRYAYVADCNDQAARIFGRGAAADLIGARLTVLSSPSDPQDLDRLRMALQAPQGFSEVERTLGGRTFLMTRKLIVENGCALGAWVTARDVTELKRAEAEVRRLNAELQHRVEELTDLKGRLEQDNTYLLDEIKAEHNDHEMIGSSPRFSDLLEHIRLVAPTSANVLITGETGTGKELVARAIHTFSPRKDRPLVRINCAAISVNLVESELFGHVKGAFTGAIERRVGRFEHANGGTIFLDEITELPAESQAKLLRVLQEQELEPVGSNRTIKIDVRVLAATNRNLTDAVREGRLRMDLYYRLMVVPVEVPPLRERRADIPALAAHFVARLARQFGRRVSGISENMMRQLVAYDWPGNVRELENFLAQALVLSRGDVLDAPLAGMGSALGQSQAPPSLEEAERRHIQGALSSTGWVIEGAKGAAAVLKINPSTLRSRMKRLGIQKPG